MRGLDDGPDGLREDVFDRAMGAKPKRTRKARARKIVGSHEAKTTLTPATGPHRTLGQFLQNDPHVNEIVRGYTAGYYGATLRGIAKLPCSPTYGAFACPSCEARGALIECGELTGIWQVISLLIEACRG